MSNEYHKSINILRSFCLQPDALAAGHGFLLAYYAPDANGGGWQGECCGAGDDELLSRALAAGMAHDERIRRMVIGALEQYSIDSGTRPAADGDSHDVDTIPAK